MYQRILVPIDGSSTATRGLDEAIRLAGLCGASLRLLHVIDELIFVSGFETGATYLNDIVPMLKRGGEAILAAGRARATAAGVPVDVVLVECLATRVSDIVVEQADAWPADLIVIGTHGRRGVSRLMLGSDAEKIVRTAHVPVLLVRSEEAPPDALEATAEAASTVAARIATATV